MNASFVIVNVETAIVRDGRYLLIVRGEEEEHAPGTLSLPGGKAEMDGPSVDVLEATARREALEEVGLNLRALAYVTSSAFIADDGSPVIDVVFLCQAHDGTPRAGDPGEVAALRWMTAAEIARDPLAPPWTQRSIALAEARRVALGW